ncbi:MAG: 2-hydroxychromene-2-carboxylate isomerase [Pseudomonadota bacterium]
MPTLTFWYEFASTYSYLSAMRVEDECRKAGTDLVWRPFLLGPIFGAQGWTTSPFNLYPAKGAYMWRDMERQIAARGLPPLTRPDPFPQNGLLAARVATIGAGEGWIAPFSRAVFDAAFARNRSISDVAVLDAVLSPIVADPQAIIERAQNDQTIKDRLKQQTADAAARGLFGAPSFTREDGELFWGDDRLEDALRWAVAPG